MDELRPQRAYGLAFVPGVPGTAPPELVVEVMLRDELHVVNWVATSEHILARVANEYFDQDPGFLWPGTGQFELTFAPDPHPRIGYGGCGYRVEEAQDVTLHFPLVRKEGRRIALTLAVLFEVLNGLPKTNRVSNRPQLLLLHTLCKREGFYAHATHGYVYPSARAWLSKAGPHNLPQDVVEAMQETWKALAPEETARYADECGGFVTEDGRFVFTCFGNACDVSMYPDSGWTEDVDYPSPFSCHNLDAHFQQLTFLSGIASLMKRIEKETE